MNCIGNWWLPAPPAQDNPFKSMGQSCAVIMSQKKQPEKSKREKSLPVPTDKGRIGGTDCDRG